MSTCFCVFKKSLFCKDLQKIRFRHLEKTCYYENCNCEYQVKFTNVFEFYGYLYHILDKNDNLDDYYAIRNHEPTFDDYQQLLRQEVRDKLETFVSLHFDYLTLESLRSDYGLTNFIMDDILMSEDGFQLLSLIFNWLFVIDEFIGRVEVNSSRKRKPFFPLYITNGVLIDKTRYSLSDYIIEAKAVSEGEATTLTDSNYLKLKNQVSSVIFVSNNDNTLSIRHHDLPKKYYDHYKSLGSNMGEFKIAFIPGIISSLEYYRYEVHSNASDEKLFFMTGLDINKYEDELLFHLEKVISAKPDIIILPELAATHKLQQRLIDKVVESNLKIILIPGSFHTLGEFCPNEQTNPAHIYNHSKVYYGDKLRYVDVYKMHPFRIIGESELRGKLSIFNNSIGVEKIDYYKYLNIIHTPIGKISILICIDLIIDEVEQALISHDVKMVFVMSLTKNPGGGKFLSQMRRFGEKNSISIFICNNPAGLVDKKDTAVVYFPVYGGLIKRQEKPVWITNINDLISGE